MTEEVREDGFDIVVCETYPYDCVLQHRNYIFTYL
jgi:hypothetical protein